MLSELELSYVINMAHVKQKLYVKYVYRNNFYRYDLSFFYLKLKAKFVTVLISCIVSNLPLYFHTRSIIFIVEILYIRHTLDVELN